MPLVQGYQSKFDKKIYRLDQRPAYIKHLKKLRAKFQRNRSMKTALKNFKQGLDKARENVTSIEELEEWLVENSKLLIANYENYSSWGDSIPAGARIIAVELDVMHREHCSNSHAAPIGKKTNWGSRDNKEPTGYPGYYGHILIMYSESYESFDSDMITRAAVNTGTGGNRSADPRYPEAGCTYRYGVTIFDMDWPGIWTTEKMNS